MDTKFILSIVTPYGEMFNGEIKSVYLPSKEGEIGILPNHCDLLSLLQAGVIEVELLDGKKELIAINWGYVEVAHNRVDVIADGAVCIRASEDSKIQGAILEAKKLLEDSSTDSLLISGALKKIEESV